MKLGKNHVIDFAILKKSRVSANVTQTARRNELKIAVKVE